MSILKEIEELEYIADVFSSECRHFLCVTSGHFFTTEMVDTFGWVVQCCQTIEQRGLA